MTVNRRWITGLGLGVLVGSIGLGVWITRADPRDQVDPKRNIILVLVDTLRADHLGLYGYEERKTTPNIDQLGLQGRWFESAWSTAPWTTPSVMSLMTSMNPAVHGFNLEGHRYASVVPTLSTSIRPIAEILRNNGYESLAVTGGGGVGSVYGFDRGFDRFFEPESVTGEDVELGVDLALKWMEATEDQPFFLFFHTYEVHLPNTHDGFDTGGSPKDQATAAYDNDLAFADRHLGRIFDELENRQQLENTLVVITSDHGENLHDRILGGRPVEHGHHLHDELLSVPLIFVAPGLIPSEGGIPDPIQLTDVMPTILSLVGISSEGLRLQGRDLRGRLQGWDPGVANRPVFAGAPLQGANWHSIRTQDARMMVTPPVDGTNWWNHLVQPAEALYLLGADPLEIENVHGTRPEIVSDLNQILQRQLTADAELRREFGPVAMAPVEDETRSNLVELGYLEP
ncbi:MAG: sulfatase-like hydrolase/transferase [Acidobacteriota bacterium]